jgi:hypothetical protein
LSHQRAGFTVIPWSLRIAAAGIRKVGTLLLFLLQNGGEKGILQSPRKSKTLTNVVTVRKKRRVGKAARNNPFR